MNRIELDQAIMNLKKLSKSSMYAKDFEDDILIDTYKFALKNMNYKLFKIALFEVLGNKKKFPYAADIKKAYSALSKERKSEWPSTDENCYLCENRGMFAYYKKDAEYIARCICSRGDKYTNIISIADIFDMQQLEKELQLAQQIPAGVGDGYEQKRVTMQDIIKKIKFFDDDEETIEGLEIV